MGATFLTRCVGDLSPWILIVKVRKVSFIHSAVLYMFLSSGLAFFNSVTDSLDRSFNRELQLSIDDSNRT